MSFEVLFCFLFGFFLRFVFFLKILTLDVDAGFIKGFEANCGTINFKDVLG